MSHIHAHPMLVDKAVQSSTMAKPLVHGAATATVHTGTQLMKNIAKHPALVFGLGVIAGYMVYKYRKEIIAKATQIVDAGKDFVLEQKESLEDIVAETKEPPVSE